MARSILLASSPLVPAAVLLLSGSATLWWSGDLMQWLIWRVGEERALGADNVIHLEGGGRLLTNPSGMVLWTLPFWLVGSAQIVAAIALVRLRLRRTERHLK
jgi:hypothetical protein